MNEERKNVLLIIIFPGTGTYEVYLQATYGAMCKPAQNQTKMEPEPQHSHKK